MNDVIAACITGGLALVGVIISSRSTRSKIQDDLAVHQAKIQQDLVVHQAITDTKIDELTREVREHNGFARRMPVLENEITHIKDDIKKYHE